MTYTQVVLLAIIQGITEFLPISSSGHLAIIQYMWGFSQQPVLFDIFVHLGTLLAIIVYFRKELRQLLKERRTIWLLFVATIPAVIVGLLLEKHIEEIFSSIRLIGVSFLLTGVILLLTRFYKGDKSIQDLKIKDVFWIGLFQAVAILPGVSRSGSTIAAGLFRRTSAEAAFTFSFLLAIPAILGAFLLSILDLKYGGEQLFLNQSIVGAIIAAIVGYIALIGLKRILIKSKFYYFGFYCLAMGIIVMLAA